VAAKAPQPGQVKTRLQRLLSEDDATELYRCFLRDTVALTRDLPETDVIISYTPAGSEPLFRELASNGNRLLLQRGNTFGERLFNALDDLLQCGYEQVVIMDADSPTLPARFLREAFERLSRPGDRVVLGPTTDGGYYLIGIKNPHRSLFERITWSSDRVLAETVARAAELALEVSLLPEWFDVDTDTDLERLWRDLSGSYPGSCASETRHFLMSRWPAGILRGRSG
jgi:rSAM/selenodomain-associated transferase 1